MIKPKKNLLKHRYVVLVQEELHAAKELPLGPTDSFREASTGHNIDGGASSREGADPA